jgi:putative phage-type endonuclease
MTTIPLDTLGVRVLDPSPAPGTPEWRRIMSASKVASVIGQGFASRFTLWHEMAGLVEPEPTNPAMLRGTLLEPAVRAWFRQAHPDWLVKEPDGMWVRFDMPWAGATPDGHVWDTPDGKSWALLECKTDGRFDHAWGQPGTDEVPLPYRCQAMWQMHITGAPRTYFAVLHAGLEFREYVVDYCEADALALADAAEEFMGTLPGQPGEQRPDIDADSSTYECVRRLHPEIDPDEQVEVGAGLGSEYLETKATLEEAERAHRLAKSQVLDLMGDARIGTTSGIKAFRRQPAGKTIALHTIKQKAA